MAHTASATTTQDLQGTAIALPTATNKNKIKSLNFLAATCSTHAIAVQVPVVPQAAEFIYTGNKYKGHILSARIKRPK